MTDIKISGFLTNLTAYVRGELVGEWVDLPLDDDEAAEVLERLGIRPGGDDEYFWTDWDSDLDGLAEYLGEHVSIADVNETVEQLQEFGDADTLARVCEVFGLRDALESCADDYCFYPGADDLETLGEVYADWSDMLIDVPAHIVQYINFEAIGRDIDYGCAGGFCSGGYIERTN